MKKYKPVIRESNEHVPWGMYSQLNKSCSVTFYFLNNRFQIYKNSSLFPNKSVDFLRNQYKKVFKEE